MRTSLVRPFYNPDLVINRARFAAASTVSSGRLNIASPPMRGTANNRRFAPCSIRRFAYQARQATASLGWTSGHAGQACRKCPLASA